MNDYCWESYTLSWTTASRADRKAACHRFLLAGQSRTTEAVRGLLYICKKHKKPVRTWVSLFVPQSWAQPCQTQPCNVKCWLSPEAGATHHNKEQKKLLLTTMRNSNSPFPPEKKPFCWEASCLVSQHVKRREREESKQGISGKIRAVFVTLPSAGQSWSHTITPLHVFYIPDSENT